MCAQAVNQTNATVPNDVRVALLATQVHIQSSSDEVRCYMPNASACAAVLNETACAAARSIFVLSRSVQSATAKINNTCFASLEPSSGEDASLDEETCKGDVTDLAADLDSLNASASTLYLYFRRSGLISRSVLGDDAFEFYRNFTDATKEGLRVVGEFLGDFRLLASEILAYFDFASAELGLSDDDDSPGPALSLPGGMSFVQGLLSRLSYPFTGVMDSQSLSRGWHLAVSSFWVFTPYILAGPGSKATGLVRFLRFLPLGVSSVAFLRFLYALSSYDSALDAAVMLVYFLCIATHGRLAFQGAGGGRAHTYRPGDWVLSIYMNGVILTGFIGSRFQDVVPLGILMFIVWLYASSNFVSQGLSLKDYLQPAVLMNTLTSASPIAIAFCIGLVEWLAMADLSAAVLGSYRSARLVKLALDQFFRLLTFSASAPSLWFSWADVVAIAGEGMSEPLSRSERDIQVAILGLTGFGVGTLVFALRLAVAYVIGRAVICRWERRRGSKPIPLPAVEAGVDHLVYALLGLCPLFWRLCPGFPFTYSEIISEAVGFQMRTSNLIAFAFWLLSFCTATESVAALTACQAVAFCAYCFFVLSYGMSSALETSRGVDAELAGTAAAINRLSLPAEEKAFLLTASRVNYKSNVREFCSSRPARLSQLSRIMASSSDWEGVFGLGDDFWDFDGLASATVVSNGSCSAVLTAEHCAVDGPKPARINGDNVHVPNGLTRLSPGHGFDPMRACAFMGQTSVPAVTEALRCRAPITGEECLFVGSRSLSWGLITSVDGTTATTEQNPMPGYSGRLCLAASDYAVLGVVSMRTMRGTPREGVISLVNVDVVNNDAGFDALVSADRTASNTSLEGFRNQQAQFVQQVSAGMHQGERPPKARICEHHLTGTCRYGDQCYNIHLSEDDCCRVRQSLTDAFGHYRDAEQFKDQDEDGDDTDNGSLPDVGSDELGQLLEELLRELRRKSTLDRVTKNLAARTDQTIPSAPLPTLEPVRELEPTGAASASEPERPKASVWFAPEPDAPSADAAGSRKKKKSRIRCRAPQASAAASSLETQI